jgi:hypothetical protein
MRQVGQFASRTDWRAAIGAAKALAVAPPRRQMPETQIVLTNHVLLI